MPCFWLRGLPPSAWTYAHCMRPASISPTFTGCSVDEPLTLPEGALAGKDGSGGPFSSEPRMRRCGWGFAVVLPNRGVTASGRGPLDYWKQTVPLAELAAAQALILCTEGYLTVVVDNASVVKGIQREPPLLNTERTSTSGMCSGPSLGTGISRR